MHPDLKAIVEVQQFDQQVADLSKEIDALPRQMQTLQTRLDDYIRAHEERKKRLAANQKERKDLDGDIKVIQEKISKHKDQLYQLKTNEQYRGMVKEIEGEEAHIREIEDNILEKMVESEELQKLVQEAAARLEGEKSRVAGEIKSLEDLRQKRISERESIQSQRKTVANSISKPVMDLYDRIRSYRALPSVAEVRNGLCMACNVRLRPQHYNDIRGSGAVMTCENCSRILYYVEPVAEELAPDGDTKAQATA